MASPELFSYQANEENEEEQGRATRAEPLSQPMGERSGTTRKYVEVVPTSVLVLRQSQKCSPQDHEAYNWSDFTARLSFQAKTMGLVTP
jgi:hypothetical protein